jgi:hypothetical protein
MDEMTYILVKFSDGLTAYQEVNDGVVQRYLDAQGSALWTDPPTGIGCVVLDAAPQRLDWMK